MSRGGKGCSGPGFHCVRPRPLLAFRPARATAMLAGGGPRVERRADPRVEVEQAVHSAPTQEILDGCRRNISENGTFIQSDQILPLDQRVLLRFSLPGIPRVFEVHGLVVWTNPVSWSGSYPLGSRGHDPGPRSRRPQADYRVCPEGPGVPPGVGPEGVTDETGLGPVGPPGLSGPERR